MTPTAKIACERGASRVRRTVTETRRLPASGVQLLPITLVRGNEAAVDHRAVHVPQSLWRLRSTGLLVDVNPDPHTEALRYGLFGVVNQLGATGAAGHYTADMLGRLLACLSLTRFTCLLGGLYYGGGEAVRR